MTSRVVRIVKRALVWLAVIAVTLLAVRVYQTQRGAPLEPWHTYIPPELSARELDKSDWVGYLKAEEEIFNLLRTEVTQKLEAEDRVPVNRYFEGSPVYPGRFAQDWNRSYVLEPDGAPAGAAVLLHGLTDSPYSVRHIARRYRAHGYVSVAIRLPAHGTVPGALTKVDWEDWMAATRLAVREARRRAPSKLLHIVGYSNGGALALKYALDALDDQTLSRPDRLVLIGPMVGITSFARFVGLAGLPAMLPRFAKAAWITILPEFNPFKYNSFPINGGRQSHFVTQALQQQITRHERDGRLNQLPPILTFQSLIDFTVHTQAIVSALYVHLPKNGSELVLFDLNRAAKLSPLLRSAMETKLTRILPEPPRRYRTTIITNASHDTSEVVERVTEAGEVTDQTRELGLSYPAELYSLSHIALPFPVTDSLYGLQPDTTEDFGINLGAVAPRGERGALIVSLDSLLRLSSNPFFPYLMGRIEETMVKDSTAASPVQ
ncbi:MAG TPA: alpha/beta hydrolase [Candidatus Binatia bacterium]|nr:alpha/beta hydrolase [Candidatus Binatia bacterium]